MSEETKSVGNIAYNMNIMMMPLQYNSIINELTCVLNVLLKSLHMVLILQQFRIVESALKLAYSLEIRSLNLIVRSILD